MLVFVEAMWTSLKTGMFMVVKEEVRKRNSPAQQCSLYAMWIIKSICECVHLMLYFPLCFHYSHCPYVTNLFILSKTQTRTRTYALHPIIRICSEAVYKSQSKAPASLGRSRSNSICKILCIDLCTLAWEGRGTDDPLTRSGYSLNHHSRPLSANCDSVNIELFAPYFQIWAHTEEWKINMVFKVVFLQYFKALCCSSRQIA